MNKEHMSGSKTPKILAAVIAIAAVAGVIGWFANRGTTNTTPIAVTDRQKVPSTGTETKKEVAVTPSTKPVDTAPSKTTTSTTTPATDPKPTPSTSSSSYKDGTYSAVGSYTSPAGAETIDVSLTLKNDVITGATVKGNATNPGSVVWQGKFNEGYQSVVVGKSVNDLALTAVNGASLTPKGFMDALKKIKEEAHS